MLMADMLPRCLWLTCCQLPDVGSRHSGNCWSLASCQEYWLSKQKQNRNWNAQESHDNHGTLPHMAHKRILLRPICLHQEKIIPASKLPQMPCSKLMLPMSAFKMQIYRCKQCSNPRQTSGLNASSPDDCWHCALQTQADPLPLACKQS